MASGKSVLCEYFLDERMSELDKRNASTEARREAQLRMEEERWHAIENKEVAEQDRQKRLQEDPLCGKKNVSGVPYNIVSLSNENINIHPTTLLTRYDESYEGRKLKHSDDMVKYRAQQRKENLAIKGHLGYNPILGEQTFPVPEPLKPQPFVEQPPKGYEAEYAQL